MQKFRKNILTRGIKWSITNEHGIEEFVEIQLLFVFSFDILGGYGMKDINHEMMLDLLKDAEECVRQMNDILAWNGLSKEDRMFYLGRKTNNEYMAQLIREIVLGDYKDEAEIVKKLNICYALANEDVQKMKAWFSKELEIDEEE